MHIQWQALLRANGGEAIEEGVHKSLIGVTGGSGGRRENSVLVNHLAFWMFHKRQFFAGFFWGGGVGYSVACTLSLLTAICSSRSLQTRLDTPGGES